MKNTTIIIALAALTCTSCLAQEPQSYTEDFKSALRNGAKVRFVVRVVDDHEIPVAHATVNTSFHRANERSIPFQELTDSNGLCIVEGITTRSTFGTVLKAGYYRSTFQFRYGDPNINDHGGSSSIIYYDSKVKNGRWLPWNPTIPVVLKPIRDPVHMALAFNEVRIPNFDEPLGFDLEKHDWVLPEGNGKITDMIVRFESTGDDVPFRKLTLEFPGAMNGAYVRKKDGYSILKSDYHAMTNSVYETRLANDDGTRGPAYILLGADDYLVFRIRSKVDHNGKVVSAMYGKIYGPFDYFVNSRNKMRLISFLNPTDNDTNLEFDGNGFGDGSPFGR